MRMKTIFLFFALLSVVVLGGCSQPEEGDPNAPKTAEKAAEKTAEPKTP